MDERELLRLAQDPATTPFDYIIVGSGAGGGPLAARLALNGRRVLLIEAGSDAALDAQQKEREVYAVPAFHGAATEDPQMSWEFSVRHFADAKRQSKDCKYNSKLDPSQNGGKGRGGILYPRCSALGGCTAHHAMIMIRPNDSDWDRIAERAGDESWRSENMQGYFPKIERCLYYTVYRRFFGRILGGLLRAVQWIATIISPERQLDPGGHGFRGWQPTSFIDPLVVFSIARRDRTFKGVLRDVIFSALASDRSLIKRALTRWQFLQFLDPNVRSPVFPDRAHLSLIPIGTDGLRRVGVREHLLDVARRHPGNLVIATETFVTRVAFDAQAPGAPRAVGVMVQMGARLYGATPAEVRAGNPAGAPSTHYFTKGEIILCGGSFNTPQILMLSGIGDRDELTAQNVQGLLDAAGNKVGGIVHLPGVGKNLQDRYEVSVISQAKREFSTLNNVSFRPGDPNDPAFAQWLRSENGLYSTNGGALAMMHRFEPKEPDRDEPDTFIFGAPAAFRGYYWGWAKELLRKTQGAAADQRDLWSWIILKAYTRNNGGVVALLSDDPFKPPQIDFNSFSGSDGGHEKDLKALREAVKKVREMNSKIAAFQEEIQPKKEVQTDAELDEWVQDEAWGHHACGTCRIGADPWRQDPTTLCDKNAVLDSKFRVHGVEGLRVVDASVFPEIPGYFIVTPVFMISEKAADTLLASRAEYPNALRAAEAAAIQTRRAAAQVQAAATPPDGALPADTVALALSGGGVRSATFALGVLQALASRKRLREIDIVSAVSGGGYVAAFLGRLIGRMGEGVCNKIARVEEILTTLGSPELNWLRQHANYLAGAGRSDLLSNVAVVTRTLVSLYFCMGALFIAFFAALRWADDTWLRGWRPDLMPDQLTLPVWVWLPLALLVGAVLPLGVGYWLGPPADASRRSPYSGAPLVLWGILLGSAVATLSNPAARPWAALAVGVLILAWLFQEVARWRLDLTDASAGLAGVRVRNRMTRWLGKAIIGTVLLLGVVLLDALARYAADRVMSGVGGAMLVMAAALPLLRLLAMVVADVKAKAAAPGDPYVRLLKALSVLAYALVALIFFFLDAVVHGVFNSSPDIGVWLLASALLVSLAVRTAFRFLNLSSLQPFYTEKLVRTFLGASNDERVHPAGTAPPLRVDVSSANDDVFFDDYHPERAGGPLHLIGTCVNETVDVLTGRQLREDKGLPMCVGPAGVSVGRRFHALWSQAEPGAAAVSVQPLPTAPDPSAFHVLARADRQSGWVQRVGERMVSSDWARKSALVNRLGKWMASSGLDREKPPVERLRLGQWMAISGAAFTTGSGRNTKLGHALLFGLLNIRLGYWWNSGIGAGERPGRFPPSLWRRLKSLPATLFPVQFALLDEWRAYFTGPGARLWYLSDGGHFDNTGIYELLRRRVPLIIAVDGGEDQSYELEDLAVLARQARLDFGAELTWFDPSAAGQTGWQALDPKADVPGWIRNRFNADAIGALSALKRDGPVSVALARVSYADDPGAASWIVVIKPAVQAGIPLDVRYYAATHASFPNEPTANQFFSDAQWESYRTLGWCAGRSIFL